MAQPTWFAGICDSMLLKVHRWSISWKDGEAYATRPMVGDQAQMIDVVTQRSVRILWKPDEVKHLVRILKEVIPSCLLTLDVASMLSNFHRCQPLPGGERLVYMRCYRKDPVEILETLLKYKTAESVDDLATFAEDLDLTDGRKYEEGGV